MKNKGRVGGVHGRYLDIDLSSKKIGVFDIPYEWIEKHLGGRGIAARIMLQELSPGIDPLGPENLLIFATGPFQGTNFAGAGRHLVMAKSPKTNSVNGSYAGGFFCHALGRSGYDGIIIRGRADRPVYLTVINGTAELRDATSLWGFDTLKTETELKARHGGVRVSSIGIAGENLVKFACIMNDRSRAVGRPGFGAVMGAKQLKAIAVRGDQEKPLNDPRSLLRIRKTRVANLLKTTRSQIISKYGTAFYLEAHNNKGMQPTKNFLDGYYDDAEKIGGLALYKKILVGRDTCQGCPVRCKRVVKTEFNGEQVTEDYGGPEYETLAAFGSCCLNANLESIALANQKCNQYGLDTISAGVSIAFAMEASERGLIPERVGWGDPYAIVGLVEKIARREGLGDRLADGIGPLAEEIGADFAMLIKGQEIPLQEPRAKKGLALTYATTPRGGQHMEGIHDDYLESAPVTPELGITDTISRFEWKKRPMLCKTYEDLTSFNNSLILCAFTVDMAGPTYNYPIIREALKAVTGIQLKPEDMITIGERNFNLLKLLAAREGYSRKDDGLPSRFEQPLPRGASAGEAIPKSVLQSYIDEYYKARGWNEYGPTEARLNKLDLAELAVTMKGE